MKKDFPKLYGSAPVLMVHDVVKTAEFYKDKLGFHFNRYWGEPPSFCILHKDQFSVIINKIDSEKALVKNDDVCKDFWDIYFWIEDVSVYYKYLVENDVPILQPLTDKPYGVREFEIKDCNGYNIAFGQELEEL